MLEFLLTIANEGDRSKVMHIYDRYHDDMLRLAQYTVRQFCSDATAHDAEEVVQNAWYKIVKYIDKIELDGNEKGLKSYVLTVVSHEAIRYMQKKRTFEPLEENIPDGDFFERLQAQERYSEVVEAIKRLDARYAIPLSLHYQHEIPVKEVARLLGLPPKTVYTRLARGKKLLLKDLGEEGKHG